MNLSIIIPLYNESESLSELHKLIVEELKTHNLSYEIIFIDDGSTDNSWEIIEILGNRNKKVKAFRFSKNFGKSQALNAGFDICIGDIVITMDADLQDSPSEIIKLYHSMLKNNYDILSGWKKKRYDSFIFKNLPSKFFNYVVRNISKIMIHDFNCGIKAYKNEVVKSIDVYGEMHRYIPLLAYDKGYTNINEKVVVHKPRKYGRTKFGINRFSNGFLDLITLLFFQKFGKRPMHFFGLIGSIMILIGFISSLYLGIDKLYFETSGRLITDRPHFYVALTTMILGAQFFVAGFVGELIVKNKPISKRYNIISSINS